MALAVDVAGGVSDQEKNYSVTKNQIKDFANKTAACESGESNTRCQQ